MCERRCYEIGGPFVSYDPECPEHGDNPNECGHDCFTIGEFIAENPNCPVHGSTAWKNYRD